MLVSGRVLLVHVMGVVGGNGWDRKVFAQLQQPLTHAVLDREPVVHELKEVVVLAQDVLEITRGLACLLVVTDPEPGLHFTRGAARGRDEALGALLQQLAVGAWIVEISLNRCSRRQPEQVVHAGGGLGQESHVGVGTGS